VLIVGTQSAAAQPLTYRQIVDRYRTSPNDGVERLLALDDSARQLGVREAVSASGTAAWTWDELAAAAMMHSDAGFYFLTEKQPAIAYFDAAERLLTRALDTSPGHATFARRWYRTVESVLKAYGADPAGQSFAIHYADRLKKTPQQLRALDAYHRGVFAEYDGCQKGEFLTITGITESGGNLVQRYFVPAARELESALTLDPDLLDAALHLGRIRMLEGRDADAKGWLQRAAASPAKSTAYLAKLFLGAFAERASEWDAAEASYRAAHTLLPHGQSGAIALAHFLDRRGRPAEGVQVLERMFGSAPSPAVDPWWLYFEEVGVENAVKIALLRAEVIR
jgi:tetratricopeptide (TPR) repeat protein